MSNHQEFPGGQDMAEEAARMAEEARRRAHATTGGVAGEAHRVVDRAADEVHKLKGHEGGAAATERINRAIGAAGQQMGGLAQQLRERAPQGQGGELAHSAAEALDRGAGYLQGADVDTLRGDLERWVRRSPLQALAVGVGVGFVIGRAFKR